MFRAAGKQIDSDKGDLKEVRPPELFVHIANMLVQVYFSFSALKPYLP